MNLKHQIFGVTSTCIPWTENNTFFQIRGPITDVKGKLYICEYVIWVESERKIELHEYSHFLISKKSKSFLAVFLWRWIWLFSRFQVIAHARAHFMWDLDVIDCLGDKLRTYVGMIVRSYVIAHVRTGFMGDPKRKKIIHMEHPVSVIYPYEPTQ